VKGRKAPRLALLAALATCALAAGPLTSQAAAAPIPTKVVAHSILVDLTLGDTQGRIPLRPSAHVYRKTSTGGTGAPIGGVVVQFFARNTGLCAAFTNSSGYAECSGTVRVLHPALALGRYQAKVPAQCVRPDRVVAGDCGTGPGTAYGASSDMGQLLTINQNAPLLQL
jgi:hypothetical protein